MRTGVELGLAEAESFPPGYPTHQPHSSAGTRCFRIPTLFIPRRVLFANHLILPTRITRGLLIPPLATHLRHSFRLSRLALGKYFYLCYFTFLHIYWPPHPFLAVGWQSLERRKKINKPVEDPRVHEPEKQTPVSEASVQHPEASADDPPPENHGASTDYMNIDPLGTKPPSPIKPSEQSTEDVLITGTGFQESGNPTVLAKHSAKEELIKKRKVKFDIANYSHLSISEVLSGYLSQVHTSRDLEIDMVKQMHQKYEVQTSTSFVNIFLQPPSLSHRKDFNRVWWRP